MIDSEFFRFNRKSLPELPDFPKVSFQEPPMRSLSEKDQDRVFEFIMDERDLKIFAFVRQYGCRVNEASGLLRENVFIDHGPPYFVLATVLGTNGQIKPSTKTKRLKVLPIIPEIASVFKPSEVTPFVFSKNGRQIRSYLVHAFRWVGST
jgi:integrase